MIASRYFSVLDGVHRRCPITLIIEGGAGSGFGQDARGADRFAREWAITRRVPYQTFHAQWSLHGRAAGPLRNERMLREGRPDAAVAFVGGNGTLDMVERLMKARIPLLDEDTRYPIEVRRVP
jgi:hypothetical protein